MPTQETEPEELLNFGGVLTELWEGNRVWRKGWNAHHMLGLQQPDEQSMNTLPYIYIIIGPDAGDLQGKRVPWVASQTDLLAQDWVRVS